MFPLYFHDYSGNFMKNQEKWKTTQIPALKPKFPIVPIEIGNRCKTENDNQDCK